MLKQYYKNLKSPSTPSKLPSLATVPEIKTPETKTPEIKKLRAPKLTPIPICTCWQTELASPTSTNIEPALTPTENIIDECNMSNQAWRDLLQGYVSKTKQFR